MKISYQKDKVKPNSDVRIFNKKDRINCNQAISLMDQDIPSGEFTFDTYEKEDGGCYIHSDVAGIHFLVNEDSLEKIIEKPKHK